MNNLIAHLKEGNRKMNELTVYHFMSDKLNLYSDIGNIMALKQRAKKRNIKINVKEINETEGVNFFKKCN